MDWKRAWLLPGTYCISNTEKVIHFKIVHKIYPVNCRPNNSIQIFGQNQRRHLHICFQVALYPNNFGLTQVGSHIFDSANVTLCFSLKDTMIIIKIDPWRIYFFSLDAKFFIHKQKFTNGIPSYTHFETELNSLLKSP